MYIKGISYRNSVRIVYLSTLALKISHILSDPIFFPAILTTIPIPKIHNAIFIAYICIVLTDPTTQITMSCLKASGVYVRACVWAQAKARMSSDS